MDVLLLLLRGDGERDDWEGAGRGAHDGQRHGARDRVAGVGRLGRASVGLHEGPRDEPGAEQRRRVLEDERDEHGERGVHREFVRDGFESVPAEFGVHRGDGGRAEVPVPLRDELRGVVRDGCGGERPGEDGPAGQVEPDELLRNEQLPPERRRRRAVDGRPRVRGLGGQQGDEHRPVHQHEQRGDPVRQHRLERVQERGVPDALRGQAAGRRQLPARGHQHERPGRPVGGGAQPEQLGVGGDQPGAGLRPAVAGDEQQAGGRASGLLRPDAGEIRQPVRAEGAGHGDAVHGAGDVLRLERAQHGVALRDVLHRRSAPAGRSGDARAAPGDPRHRRKPVHGELGTGRERRPLQREDHGDAGDGRPRGEAERGVRGAGGRELDGERERGVSVCREPARRQRVAWLRREPRRRGRFHRKPRTRRHRRGHLLGQRVQRRGRQARGHGRRRGAVGGNVLEHPFARGPRGRDQDRHGRQLDAIPGGIAAPAVADGQVRQEQFFRGQSLRGRHFDQRVRFLHGFGRAERERRGDGDGFLRQLPDGDEPDGDELHVHGADDGDALLRGSAGGGRGDGRGDDDRAGERLEGRRNGGLHGRALHRLRGRV